MLFEIVFIVIGGFFIGLVGKFLAPGNRDNIPLWLTTVCGVGGLLLGRYIYAMFGGDGSWGVDWTKHIVQVICAAGLVAGAASATGQRKIGS